MKHLGLIGLGYWGNKYFSILKNLNFNLYVADINSERLKKANGFKQFSSGKELIENIKPEFLFIITEPQNHYELFELAMQNNIKRVLIEKPLFLNSYEFLNAKKFENKIFEGYIFLYSEHIQYILKEINSINKKPKSIIFLWFDNSMRENHVDIVKDLISHPLSILFSIIKYYDNLYIYKKNIYSKFHVEIGLTLDVIDVSIILRKDFYCKQRKIIIKYDDFDVIYEHQKRELFFKNKYINIEEKKTPLENMIDIFLFENRNLNLRMSHNIMNVLEAFYEH